jgi:predicted nucleic acid-binding protein
MRALDTNVLVYALVAGTDRHERARQVLIEHAEGTRPWALPWPCAYEFLRVVTHPAIFESPMPIERAASFLERLLDSASGDVEVRFTVEGIRLVVTPEGLDVLTDEEAGAVDR